jgi:hypothetical protein
MRGIYWLAEKLLAFLEEPCIVELVCASAQFVSAEFDGLKINTVALTFWDDKTWTYLLHSYFKNYKTYRMCAL